MFYFTCNHLLCSICVQHTKTFAKHLQKCFSVLFYMYPPLKHFQMFCKCFTLRVTAVLGPFVFYKGRPLRSAKRGPYVLLLFISFLSFFYSARDLRGLSADRSETMPHDRKWVQLLKTGSENWGSSSQKIGVRKTCFLTQFRTTSHFDREYLRNGTRYRQSENGVANYDLSRVC